jgi:hypothetical protein
VRDALCVEPIGDALLDHLTGRPELGADRLGLADERVEDDVLFPLHVNEVAAEDLRRRLQFAVDAAIALLQPRRVPRQIDMDQVVAAGLQIDALASGVGADQDTQRFGRRFGVEGELDRLAAVCSGDAGEDADPLVGAIGVIERLLQPALQPAPGILPFSEKDQPPVVPSSRRHHVGADPLDEPGHPRVWPCCVLLRDRQHLVDRGEFG